MKVGIYTNTMKDAGLVVTRALIAELKHRGINYFVDSSLRELDNQLPLYELVEKVDCLFVVGGDGTILNVVYDCAKHNVPIMGINVGTIGFLTEAEISEIPVVVENLIQKNFSVDTRYLIRAELGGKSYFALNEVLICRGDDYHLVKYEVVIGDCVINNYAADGFIISTPTGSTAYSLSCGGPIMSPHVEAMVLVPVNPHSLMSRAIVIGDGEVSKLRILNSRSRGNLVLDGRLMANLFFNDTVTVCKSDLSVGFVRMKEQNFYTRLFEKLDIWSRRS